MALYIRPRGVRLQPLPDPPETDFDRIFNFLNQASLNSLADDPFLFRIERNHHGSQPHRDSRRAWNFGNEDRRKRERRRG